MLKNSKNEFYQKSQISQNFEKLIDKKYINSDIDNLIKSLINSERIFVFIKGSPEFPYCKFTKKLIKYLNEKKVEYGHFNIFTNQNLRERLKVYSNWKTYPQLYIEGKLIGGNDTIEQLEKLGEMNKLLYK